MNVHEICLSIVKLSVQPIVDDEGRVIGEAEETEVLDRYQQLKERISTTFLNCEDSQHRLDLISALNKALDEFQPISTEDILLPADIATKGRPKLAIGSRLLSAFEISEKDAKQREKNEKKNDSKKDENNDDKKEKKKGKKTAQKRKAKVGNDLEDLWPSKRSRSDENKRYAKERLLNWQYI